MSGMLNKRRAPIKPCFEGEKSESETLHSHLLAPCYTFRANSVFEPALNYEAVIGSSSRCRQGRARSSSSRALLVYGVLGNSAGPINLKSRNAIDTTCSNDAHQNCIESSNSSQHH